MADETRQDELERLLDEGERLFYNGRYDEALSQFDKAVELDEDDADAHYLRARTFFYMGRDDESLSAYDRALDIDPDFVAAIVHKAELLVRALGWPDEALDLLDEAEELGLTREDKTEAALVRGLAHIERQEYRQALEHLNRAVRGDAEWVEARRERAICRFYLWRFEDAARDFGEVLQQDAGDPEANYCLAMSLERLGKETEARKHYSRAVEIDPQTYHVPMRVSRGEFAKTAEQAVAELPEEFRIRFDNLSFHIEDYPERQGDVLPDLLGQYVATALPERPGAGYIHPTRIVLYQRNLERVASDAASLRDEIGKTVLQEVGSYFGLSEEDLLRLEIH